MSPTSGWFALQLAFAERAARITGRPFAAALLEFTNVYRRLGLGRSRDPDHPLWRAYLGGLGSAADPAAFTAALCRAHEPPGEVVPFGCFHYDYEPTARRVRLHFAGRDDSGVGPLSRDRLAARRAELAALFAAVARDHPSTLTVRGVSWLHGIEAYRRLYPPVYGRSARPLPTERVYPSMPLWGQFLDHRGRVKDDLAAAFLDRLARAESAADLAACFPRPVYAAECAVEPFYDFYGVARPG